MTENLWRDRYWDAEDRIRELEQDRALLISVSRQAAHTLQQADYPQTAQSLRKIVSGIEQRDAQRLAEREVA